MSYRRSRRFARMFRAMRCLSLFLNFSHRRCCLGVSRHAVVVSERYGVEKDFVMMGSLIMQLFREEEDFGDAQDRGLECFMEARRGDPFLEPVLRNRPDQFWDRFPGHCIKGIMP